MVPTTVLPEAYEPRGTIDLSKNRTAALVLNAVSFVLLLPAGWLLLQFLALTRSEFRGLDFTFEAGVFEVLIGLLAVPVLFAIEILAHEAIHGACYWGFTGQPPVFGVGPGYAYAGAPGWYIPRGRFVLAAMAPLFAITVVGLSLMLVLPGSAVWAALFVVAINAVGSIGDLIAVAWVLAKPPATLVRDTGDAVTIYQPI